MVSLEREYGAEPVALLAGFEPKTWNRLLRAAPGCWNLQESGGGQKSVLRRERTRCWMFGGSKGLGRSFGEASRGCARDVGRRG